MINQTSRQAKRYTPKVKWRAIVELLSGPELFVTDTSVRQLEKKISQLENLPGKKEVEIAFLKNWLDISD